MRNIIQIGLLAFAAYAVYRALFTEVGAAPRAAPRAARGATVEVSSADALVNRDNANRKKT